MYTLEKAMELVWEGLSQQCFTEKQSMILRKVLFTLIYYYCPWAEIGK